MATLHDMASALKAKTDAGAVLMFDGEIWERPRWKISAREVSFGNSCCRIILWSRDEDYASKQEAIRVLKKRIRVLVDA